VKPLTDQGAITQQIGVQYRAVMTMLDVVEEIAWKVGDPEWAQVVTEVFESHRRELRTGEIEN